MVAPAALALAYGEKIECSGPRFTGLRGEGRRGIVHFDHFGGGRVAKNGELRGFTVLGDGKTFEPAEAEIIAETVVVSVDGVPVAVRYAWSNVPGVNLFNAAGLPAVPFRTDETAAVGHKEQPVP